MYYFRSVDSWCLSYGKKTMENGGLFWMSPEVSQHWAGLLLDSSSVLTTDAKLMYTSGRQANTRREEGLWAPSPPALPRRPLSLQAVCRHASLIWFLICDSLQLGPWSACSFSLLLRSPVSSPSSELSLILPLVLLSASLVHRTSSTRVRRKGS